MQCGCRPATRAQRGSLWGDYGDEQGYWGLSFGGAGRTCPCGGPKNTSPISFLKSSISPITSLVRASRSASRARGRATEIPRLASLARDDRRGLGMTLGSSFWADPVVRFDLPHETPAGGQRGVHPVQRLGELLWEIGRAAWRGRG